MTVIGGPCSGVPSSSDLVFALEQSVAQMSVAAGTTGTITLDSNIPASPRLLVFGLQFSSTPAELLSANRSITLIPVPATRGGSQMSWGMHFAYALHSAGAATSIELTFAGNHGGANLYLWEISYTGTGTPALDCATRDHVPSGTSVAGPELTLSVGNAVVLQMALSQNNVTAVAAPYTDHDEIVSGCGFAALLNSATAPAATWTIDSTSQSAFAAIAFGKSPSTFKSQAVCTFESGTDGADCTAALLKSSTTGYRAGVWTVEGSGAAMKFATAANKPLTNASGRLCDGTSVSAGAGSKGVRFLTATSNSYLKWDTTPGIGSTSHVDSDVYSAGVWFRSTLPDDDDSNLDVFNINAPGGSGFANAKFLTATGAKRAFQLEVTGGGGNNEIVVDTNTWYWLALFYDRGTQIHKLRVYDASLTLLGELTEATTSTGYPGYVVIGQSSSNTPTTGFACDFDSLKIDVEGTWPLLP